LEGVIQIRKETCMTQRLMFASLILLAGAAGLFVPAPRADEWDKLTVLTFNDRWKCPARFCRLALTSSSWLTASPTALLSRCSRKTRNNSWPPSWRYRITAQSQLTTQSLISKSARPAPPKHSMPGSIPAIQTAYGPNMETRKNMTLSLKGQPVCVRARRQCRKDQRRLPLLTANGPRRLAASSRVGQYPLRPHGGNSSSAVLRGVRAAQCCPLEQRRELQG
jgi:hypothetical protein